MIRTWAWIRCSEGQCSPLAVYRCTAVCTAVQQGGGRGHCGVCSQSQLGGSEDRSREWHERVTSGDKSDIGPGETKEHCAAVNTTTIHKLVITTFYDWDLGLTMDYREKGWPGSVWLQIVICCSVANYCSVVSVATAGRYEDIMRCWGGKARIRRWLVFLPLH